MIIDPYKCSPKIQKNIIFFEKQQQLMDFGHILSIFYDIPLSEPTY